MTNDLADRVRDHERWLSSARAAGVRLELVSADPAGADLAGRDLSEAWLDGCDLSGARLPGAWLLRTRMVGCRLVDADLTGTRMRKAELTETVAHRARFTGADLTVVAFERADLSGADLTRAYLAGTDLEDADLTGAVLRSADLDRVHLGGTRLDDGTDVTDVAGTVMQAAARVAPQEAELAGGDLIGWLRSRGARVELFHVTEPVRTAWRWPLPDVPPPTATATTVRGRPD